jgi:hypothetical protein
VIDPLRNLKRRLRSKGMKGMVKMAGKLPGHQITMVKVKKLAGGGALAEEELPAADEEFDEEDELLGKPEPDEADLPFPPAGGADAAMVENLSPADQMKKEIVVAAMQAVRGQHPNPEEAIQEFIETFGQEEFQELRQMVLGQEQDLESPGGRLVEGEGAGQEDKIEGTTPGGSPVLLSDGEYVVDAPTVAALGDGSNRAGADRLDAMREEIRKQAYGSKQQARPMKDGGRAILAKIRK